MLTAAQGGTCVIIKVECCGNVSAALHDMKNQVKAMSNEKIPFWTLVLSWVKGVWWKTVFTIVIVALIVCFVDLNWPWLPIGWVGCYTLGFTFAHGSIKPNLQQALVNLPYLHARWTRSVFQWYEYIAASFVPSMGTTDIMIKVEALTNFIKQALLDGAKAILALNEEQIQMRKAVIQK